MSREFLDCLKRERDIRIKPKLSGGKTAFRCTPALNCNSDKQVNLQLANELFNSYLTYWYYFFKTIYVLQTSVWFFSHAISNPV